MSDTQLTPFLAACGELVIELRMKMRELAPRAVLHAVQAGRTQQMRQRTKVAVAAQHDDQQGRGRGDRDHAPQPATAPPRHRGDLRGDPGAPEMILRLGRERLDGAGVTKQVEDGQLGVDRASAAVLGLSGPQRVLPARVQDGLGSAARDRCVLSVAR